MLINLNHLSEDKLNLIPISIRLHYLNINDGLVNTDDLPYEIAHELITLNAFPVQNTVIDKSVIELKPKLNIYNDFEVIETKKDAIIEYIRNYFTVNRGDYPFDPTFGTRLKEYLNTLDVPTQKLLISNEVSDLVSTISVSFGLPVKISNLRIYSTDMTVSSEVNIDMTVDITEQSITKSYNVNLIQFVS